MMRRSIVGIAVLLLAGCISMAKVGPGEVVVRDRLAVTLDSAWNRLEGAGGKAELWTTDGFPLDLLRFYVGIKDGESLVEVGNGKDKQVPRFRAAMQPQEIVEMVDALVSQGGDRFRLDKLAPASFAGGNGFRFDYGLVRRSDEVELKGFAYGVVRDRQLFLLMFQAPKLYYYGRNAERAEKVARSVRFKG